MDFGKYPVNNSHIQVHFTADLQLSFLLWWLIDVPFLQKEPICNKALEHSAVDIKEPTLALEL